LQGEQSSHVAHPRDTSVTAVTWEYDTPEIRNLLAEHLPLARDYAWKAGFINAGLTELRKTY